MGVCMLILGILESTHNRIAGLMVALFAIHASTFAISAGTIGWTMVAEVSTPRLRAKTAGFAAGGTACFGLIFNYTVPIMLANPGANWGLNIGYFWAGLIIVSLGIMWYVVPETKGRTYSELDELFERRVPAWRFKTTKTSVDDLKASVET
jgi:SP family general alpha glucoside:H+ symporter-like MFS transporter